LLAATRGPKPDAAAELKQHMRRLERENERLQNRLRQAEAIIEVQKKVSEILGISLASSAETDEAS
jgi:hypothetical protein